MSENLSTISFGEKLLEFKNNFFKSKKYWIIYLIFIIIASLSMFTLNNYANPVKEIIFIIIVAIFGVFTITFYSYHNDDKEMYKTAFVIIILFGLLCCFLNPIANVSDETEHIARADITSQGIIMPEYNNGSYAVSASIQFFEKNRTHTFTEVNGNTPYNETLIPYHSAFQQNPFYGYIPQAIGLLIAKLFDLSVIWSMWLGRIFNLLLYAGLISYAVKKTPSFKIPFIAMACIPVAIQQAASFSIDSMFIGLGILVFAYFFYMIKAPDNTLENKDTLIFSILCLLFGLCRLPCLAAILLIFCVPSNKFRAQNATLYKFIGFFIVAIIGFAYSSLAMPNYLHSGWRLTYVAQHNFNSTEQMAFMLSHPAQTAVALLHMINALDSAPLLTGFASLYSTVPGNATMYRLGFISGIIPLFVGAVWLLYPNTDDFELKERIGALIVMAIIFFGTCLTQMLTWAPVGDLYTIAVHTRYVLPLFVLVPFIFGMNHVKERNYEVDSYIICLTCCFVAAFIIQIIARYY